MYKLYSATLELTRKCNARCKHCIIDAGCSKNDELSTERILKLIEELHDEGCGDLTLTPHLGASTAEAQINVALDVAEQIRDVFLGSNARSAVKFEKRRILILCY